MPRKKAPINLPKTPSLDFEQKIWADNMPYIAGLDEAGRGAWAGPVAAAAVILPQSPDLIKNLAGVKDSKLMTVKQRETWAKKVKTTALTWAVGFSTHAEIDQMGIIPATRLAMRRALEALDPQPNYLLIDALRLPTINLPQEDLIKGDRRSLSIAAASVLAKTARDAWMREQDALYPNYAFGKHKGYGTKQHQTALAEHGPSPIHRLSFNPLREGLFEAFSEIETIK